MVCLDFTNHLLTLIQTFPTRDLEDDGDIFKSDFYYLKWTCMCPFGHSCLLSAKAKLSKANHLLSIKYEVIFGIFRDEW